MKYYFNYKKIEEFIVVLAIIFSGFVTMAIFKISNFHTFLSLDEMLWHYRSRFFWDRILNFDFSELIQSAQPGITVYWFTGYTMKFLDFDFTTITRLIAEKEKQGIDFNFINANDPVLYKSYEAISFVFNAPMILLIIIFFITFYYLLKKLDFGVIIASFSLMFLVTDPYLFFWTTPSDKMLMIFLTISFLAALVYANDTKNKKYLIISAVFGAWATLSKLSALFIFPFYLFIFTFYSWPLDKSRIRLIIKDYATWIAIFALICVLFLPTIITNPDKIYNLIFNSPEISTKDHVSSNYFSGLLRYANQLVSILFANMSIPKSIFFLFFVFVIIKKKIKYFSSSISRKHILTITIFVILFPLMVTTIANNKDIRFMAPAIAISSIISALGLYIFVDLAIKRFHIKNHFVYSSALIAVLLSQMFSILSNSFLMDEIFKKVSRFLNL